MQMMPIPRLAGVAFAVICGAFAAAVPTVDPVTQLQPVPQYQIVYALVVGQAVDAAKKVGDHETAGLYQKVLETPIPPEDVPRYEALATEYGASRRAGDTAGLMAVSRQLAQHAAAAYAQRAKTPTPVPPQSKRAPAKESKPASARPAPWHEYTRMRKLRDMMNAEMALRQRVKMRTAEVAIGNELPLLYPAFHWLPHTMIAPAIVEWSGQSSKEGMAEQLGHNHVVLLFSLFNVKIYKPDDARVQCCAPEATLTVELAASEEEVDLVDIRMEETEPGVYHIAEPFRASDEVLGHVVTMGARPYLSIVRLEGVGYRGAPNKPTIAYAVRWGDLELEYGSHSWLDPEAVIR